jgi:hypothetical protein
MLGQCQANPKKQAEGKLQECTRHSPPQSRAMQVFTQVALRFGAIKKGFGDLFLE